ERPSASTLDVRACTREPGAQACRHFSPDLFTVNRLHRSPSAISPAQPDARRRGIPSSAVEQRLLYRASSPPPTRGSPRPGRGRRLPAGSAAAPVT
ncbi:hypothetical protein P7K49_035559, partial [Saguinus oedipus]